MTKISLVGQTFGRLKVIGEASNAPCNKTRSLCLCACGKQTIVRNDKLVRGDSGSCGCLALERQQTSCLKHGHAKHDQESRIYRIWKGMKRRCTAPTCQQFMDYGGRGITVCNRWFDSFENFFADMGSGKIGWMLERVNNDGNYEVFNCVWATRTHQNRNTRRNRVVTVRGFTGCVTAAAEKFGASPSIVNHRLHYGWTIEDALFKPVRKRHH